MSRFLPNACSRYGVSMGRRSTGAGEAPSDTRANLYKLHLNVGGYDSGGAYWGHGEPLWRVVIKSTGDEAYFRANTRFEAWLKACEFYGAQLRVKPHEAVRA